MKSIYQTTINGQTIFLACRLCSSLLKIENKIGCKFEPTGLNNDNFGISYISRFGQIYSLNEFKSLYL